MKNVINLINMNQFKGSTKYARSGLKKHLRHSPHYVVCKKSEPSLSDPFFNREEAKEWADKNVNEYYEIHKDYFVG